MRKIYWYLTAYIRKHGLKFVLAIVLGIGVFSLLIPYLARNFSHRQTHYIGLVGTYTLHSLPDLIKDQLSDGLMVAEPDGTLAPNLAELTIKDGTSYIFTFEDNIFWQDGKKFVTTDVNYRLREAQVIFDTNSITYNLPAISASFPQLLTEPILRFDTNKKWYLFESEMVYGLGDTLLLNYRYADNSHHALSQVTLLNQKTRERFIYRFYYTETAAITAYKLGEVDILYDIINLDEIKDWESTVVTERLIPDQYLAVFFNHADPIMTKNFRQALSYAVEKERAGFTRALGPIPETSWAFFNGTKRYDKNIDSAAERLLDELPGAPIELKLSTIINYYDIANRIKEDWEALGTAAAETCLQDKTIENKTVCEYLRLKVTIQTQTFPDTSNFQALLIGQQVSTDPDQYGLWHSELATNFTHYKNTKVDNDLEKGRQTLSAKERLTLYQEFQQNLLEDPPAIFLWYLKSSDLMRHLPDKNSSLFLIPST